MGRGPEVSRGWYLMKHAAGVGARAVESGGVAHWMLTYSDMVYVAALFFSYCSSPFLPSTSRNSEQS